MNSTVRMGVSPATSASTGVFDQRFGGFIFLHWNHGLYSVSRSPVVPPGLSARECGTAQARSHHLVGPPTAALPAPVFHPLPFCKSSLPGCLFPPLLLVWMNVSSLIPLFLDFCTFRVSVNSGFFVCLFLNMLLFSFCLCEKAQCVLTMFPSSPDVLSVSNF